MKKQPWEDCEQTRQPFYTPADAAIRWCGLTAEDARIRGGLSEPWHVRDGEWHSYPCLAVHSRAIEYAFTSGNLRYGREGKTVADGEAVNVARRTVEHGELKAWIRREYPADVQKPHMAWLFDEVERSMHPGLSSAAYSTLKAEADSLRKRAEEAEARERQPAPVTDVDQRERVTLLCIIGALARQAGLDLSQHMKAGDTVAAMAPELTLSGRTIGEHLKKVGPAMDSRTK